MRRWLRDREVATAAALTAASLAVVFGAALQAFPVDERWTAPSWVFTAIPHVNALLAVLALLSMTYGVVAIRRGRVRRHRWAMVLALLAFVGFLGLYLYNVAINGPTAFPGPDLIRSYVYLPVLVIHVSLAILCLPLLYYVLLVAVTRPVEAIYGTRHASVARPAVLLWAIAFLLGLTVYLQLHVIYS